MNPVRPSIDTSPKVYSSSWSPSRLTTLSASSILVTRTYIWLMFWLPTRAVQSLDASRSLFQSPPMTLPSSVWTRYPVMRTGWWYFPSAATPSLMFSLDGIRPRTNHELSDSLSIFFKLAVPAPVSGATGSLQSLTSTRSPSPERRFFASSKDIE